MQRMVAAYSGLIVLSVIWGLAFVAIKQADFELSPVNLALLRWFIASVFFLSLVPIIGRPKTRLERKDIPRLLVVAFANVAGYHISLYYGETTDSAWLAGLLISFGPVFIVILSVLLLNEKAAHASCSPYSSRSLGHSSCPSVPSISATSLRFMGRAK